MHASGRGERRERKQAWKNSPAAAKNGLCATFLFTTGGRESGGRENANRKTPRIKNTARRYVKKKSRSRCHVKKSAPRRARVSSHLSSYAPGFPPTHPPAGSPHAPTPCRARARARKPTHTHTYTYKQTPSLGSSLFPSLPLFPATHPRGRADCTHRAQHTHARTHFYTDVCTQVYMLTHTHAQMASGTLWRATVVHPGRAEYRRTGVGQGEERRTRRR